MIFMFGCLIFILDAYGSDIWYTDRAPIEQEALNNYKMLRYNLNNMFIIQTGLKNK